MKSKITGGETKHIFTTEILGKYVVKYFECLVTGFIQTEEPYWLEEAYSSAITSLDIGLVSRNIRLADITEKIIGENLDADKRFLDYAGGYGMFTRIMRDKGYDFYHTDKFCDNLFAKHFDLTDTKQQAQFEMVTAFELFEHLVQPLDEIKKMLAFSDTILFSTEIVPNHPVTKPGDWWYIAPETGQHVSFYTVKSLQYIADQFGLKLYTNNSSLHMLSARKDLEETMFAEIPDLFGDVAVRKWNPAKKSFKHRMKKMMKEKMNGKYIFQRKSLLEQDFNHVKSIVSKKS